MGAAAQVCEIFSSLQGEGIYSGCRHLFLRLAGCNLRCTYCDTKESFFPPSRVRIEYPNKKDPEMITNPVTVSELWEILEQMQPARHHCLSITGGEPLLQPDVVREISLLWRKNGGKVLLETNGTLVAALQAVASNIDIVSMDVKLSPAIPETPWEAHRQFLTFAYKNCSSVYVKLVIAREVKLPVLAAVARMIAGVNCEIPLILQPVSAKSEDIPSDSVLSFYQWELSCVLSEVRILPQLHKLIGLR